MTEQQAERVTREWSEIAGEAVRVERVGASIHAFGSELATLRLYRRFLGTGSQGYSLNMSEWFFTPQGQ